jgi:hypothetical protein
MGKRNGPWTQEELVKCLCFYAYYPAETRAAIPARDRNQLSRTLPNRSEASIAIRLANYVARDPEQRLLGKVGMAGGGSHVDVLWASCSDKDGNVSFPKLLKLASLTLRT